jgi:hypothetical protein
LKVYVVGYAREVADWCGLERENGRETIGVTFGEWLKMLIISFSVVLWHNLPGLV